MPSLKYWDGTQYVPILGGIGQGAADARYVKQAGDTMTGALTMLAEDGTARSLVMAPASNGATGIRLIQASGVTAGDLAPLGVLDPALPEHAATRGWVEALTYAGNPSPGTGWTLALSLIAKRAGWVGLKVAGSKNAAVGIETAFTVPVGFRPVDEWPVTVQGGTGTGGGIKVYAGSIDAAGALRVRGNVYPAASEALTFIANYPAL